jgi:hypothetical protein
MSNGMSLGRVFFRDLQDLKNGRKQFVFTGKIWVPADSELKGEQVYVIVGSDLAVEGKGTLSLQMWYESAEDMTEQTKKKDLNKVLPMIQSPY